MLASHGIAHRLEPTGAGWMVMVAAGDAGRASSALVEYDRENRDEVPSHPSPPPYGTSWIGGVIATLLVGFFAVTGPVGPRSGLTEAVPLPGRFCPVRCGAR